MYLDLARGLKQKLWDMKVTAIPIVIGVLCTVIKWLVQWLEDLKKEDELRPSNILVTEIDQNAEKSPGDMKTVALTETPLKDHQLTLMWKTLKK